MKVVSFPSISSSLVFFNINIGTSLVVWTIQTSSVVAPDAVVNVGCMGSFGWSYCVSCVIFGAMVCLLSGWKGLLIILLVCICRCFHLTKLACAHGEASTSSMQVSSWGFSATIEFCGANLMSFTFWWGCCLSVYDVFPIFLSLWRGIKSLGCVNNGTPPNLVWSFFKGPSTHILGTGCIHVYVGVMCLSIGSAMCTYARVTYVSHNVMTKRTSNKMDFEYVLQPTMCMCMLVWI
jgi:hypothetical protein